MAQAPPGPRGDADASLHPSVPDSLDLYDFGARMYSPSNMRWLTMDPLCEKYYSISPYAYCAGDPIKLIDPNGQDWYEYTDEEGNTQSIWRPSHDKIFKDEDGNMWENIGEFFLNESTDGSQATLYTQYTNENGELCLNSQQFDLSKEDESKALSASLIGLLPVGSSIAGMLGDLGEGSKATFRLTNSKGAFDFKVYGNGWLGNQYVSPMAVAKLGKVLSDTGKVFGFLATAYSVYQFTQASSFDERFEHGLDALIGVVGFVPVGGSAVSLFWSLGGKQLVRGYSESVIVPLIEKGVNPGLPAYQPFK